MGEKLVEVYLALGMMELVNLEIFDISTAKCGVEYKSSGGCLI